jgi:hypothetical protein
MTMTHSHAQDAPSVDRESVVPLPRRQTSTVTVEPPPAQTLQPIVVQPRADAAFVGTLAAITAILASRLLLLLAIIGGFVLAVRATDMTGLSIMVAYAVLIVLPLAALDIVAHKRGGQ